MAAIHELDLDAWYMQRGNGSIYIKGDDLQQKVLLLKQIKGSSEWTPESKPQPKRRNKSNLPPRYRSYISSANKRGISFTLSVEEFDAIVKNPCVYCGHSGAVGVDRYDSSLGYDFDNCQPCCGKCNMMKHVHNNETFLSHVRQIYKHSIEKY